MVRQNRPAPAGFTFLETAVALSLMALLATGAATIFVAVSDERRQDETVEKLMALKHAIAGDPRIVTKESRTDFGYIGEMGSLPASLEDLWILGSQPAYSFDTSLGMGTGWAGPYISSPTDEGYSGLALDGWGNPIVYDTSTGVSAATGQTYRARLTSYGPDADAGGGDDLVVEIYETELFSDVVGYIRDASGNPLTGVEANLNHPSAGGAAVKTTTTDGTGAYLFDNVPFGNRSISVEPALVYVADTAFTKGGANDDVEFVIQNFAEDDIVITSFAAEYDEEGYYRRLVFGNDTVFNDAGDRAGSGELLSFPGDSITIKGAGSSAGRIVPIRIQSRFTLGLDQNIGQSAEAGATKRVKLREFTLQENGGGGAVDMTGISFQATFSDGSVVIFTPERK